MFARSWVATVESKSAAPLLGGLRRNQSSRFGSSELASAFLGTAIEINGQAGISALGGVTTSTLPPEIFVHCGYEIGCVGGKCPACGRVLTERDAREYSDRNGREVAY